MTTVAVARPSPPAAAAARDERATSALRMWAYALLLAAVAFVQDPGRIVADTKWDLAADPSSFLVRALHLWDPVGAFGQIQNQAYGYFFPMGPFFVGGHALGLPAWVVQRLWWTALLVVAFVGVVRLSQALRLGVGWTQVLAGFAFALSSHILTLLGPTSVEAWPSAVAPWVLLALVRGCEGGSVRRAGAWAALGVLLCGGVNAAATAAVLPLGVVFLLTRARGPRRWALLGWWTSFTVLATLWWVVPLLVLGRYSPSFLDYIESAAVTSRTTGLADVLGGTSDWVSYASFTDWRAGHLLATTPFLLVDAAAVACLGLAGICRRDNRHARFLVLSLLVGAALVSFGYAGEVHGWWALGRQDALDGVLAPLRNVHKFDVVMRIPLVLGLAHLLAVLRAGRTDLADRVVRWSATAIAVVAVVGVAAPAYLGEVAPAGSFTAAPSYWRRVADYLQAHDRGSMEGSRALLVPAAAFGDYTWGSTHDDVFQPFAQSPWAVRNVIPLAQPGNVRMLDAVTSVLEAGRPDDRLAGYLASNGVGYLVVRNDLDPGSGGPNPVVLHQALDQSPGLSRVAAFGPLVGGGPVVVSDTGSRLYGSRGRQQSYPAVEVYRVAGESGPVSAYRMPTVPVVYGDPGSALALTGLGQRSPPTLLAGDAAQLGDAVSDNPVVVTDGLKRREANFAYVRDNVSSTLGPHDPYRLQAVEPNYRLYADDAPYETLARWYGVSDVTASSSQADADAVGTITPSQLPAAAFDADPSTQWQSTGFGGAVGQWWEVDLLSPTVLHEVTITMGPSVGPAVTQLELRTSSGARAVEAPRPGQTSTYELPKGATSYLRITVTEVHGGGDGVQVSLADVAVPGVSGQRVLATPSYGLTAAPALVTLARDVSRPACVTNDHAVSCDDAWVRTPEDLSQLGRVVTTPEPAAYYSHLTASVRPGRAASRSVSATLPVVARASSVLSRDLRASAVATVDGDPSTTWVASAAEARPTLTLTWSKPARLTRIRLGLNPAAPASRPTEVVLAGPGQRRHVRLDADGTGSFAPLRTDRVEVTFVRWRQAYSAEGGSTLRLPVGVTQVELPGSTVPLNAVGSTSVHLGCGSGPTIVVDGAATRTSVGGPLASLMSYRPLRTTACTPDAQQLDRGGNVILVHPSAVALPEQLTLSRVGAPPLAPQTVGSSVGTWGAVGRRVTVSASDTDTLLVVAENANAGWVARARGATLTPVRVDGWKQGWIVPAGPAVTVVLTYQPDTTYRWGLGLGALAVLVVVGAALLRGGSRLAPVGPAAGRIWVDLAVVAVVLGLLAGWWGIAAGIVAVTVVRLRRPPPDAGLVVGLVALVGCVVQALGRTETHVVTSALAQMLIVAALAFGAALVLANGPEFFSRRNGRSSP